MITWRGILDRAVYLVILELFFKEFKPSFLVICCVVQQTHIDQQGVEYLMLFIQ